MKRFWKKTTAGLLALLTVFGASYVMPYAATEERAVITASADDTISDDYSYSVNEDGTSVTINKWFGSAEEVNVPAELDGLTVTGIAGWTFYDKASIVRVKLPDTVNSIGSNAFNSCSSLKSINIPKGVTEVSDSAFVRCTSLEEIEIPNSVKSIGVQSFAGCTALKSINVPESVKSIGGSAFRDTAWLEARKAETPLVIVNKMLIDGTTATGNVTIPDGVTYIGDMAFSGSSGLTGITVPGFVKGIGENAFSQCPSLSSVTIKNGVESLGYQAFANCSALTEIELPDSVTSIGGSAFFNCGKLTTAVLPSNLDVISNSLFMSCSSLKDLTLPDTAGSIEFRAFVGCSSLKKIVVPEGVTSIGMQAFAMCPEITSFTVPGSVTSIGYAGIPMNDGIVVKGIPGSGAEEYAKQYSLTFVDSRAADAEISSVSLTLSDDLGLNFIVGEANADNYRNYSIRFSGKCSEDGKTVSVSSKTVNGKKVYCASSGVYANNMKEEITAELYKNGVMIDRKTFSVFDYLNAESARINALPEMTSGDKKLLDLVSFTMTYGKVADNYFNGASNDVSILDGEGYSKSEVISRIGNKQLMINNEVCPVNSDAAKLSLALDSKMAVRLYIRGVAAGTEDDSRSLSTVAGKKGGKNYPSYFEFSGLTPLQLGDMQTVIFGDNVYNFSALAWAYRTLTNSDATENNVYMAKAVALYAYYAGIYADGQ